MSVIRGKETNAQTLAGIAILLIAAALVIIVTGAATGDFGAVIFGGIIFGMAVLIGLIGMGMDAFRR